MWKITTISFLFFLLIGCTAHPTISPIPLQKDESYTGITLSAENVFPMFVYRKGLSEKSDVGVRIGIPFYGTGVDYSRLLYQRGNYYDILNVSFSYSPNSNFDMTYYTVRKFRKWKNKAFYTGVRGMYIPHGINGNQSLRFGFLAGFCSGNKWGFEFGYFHDLDRGQPIESLLSWHPKNDEKYPATTEFGYPTENSRLMGLSFQVYLSTKIFSKSDKKEK